MNGLVALWSLIVKLVRLATVGFFLLLSRLILSLLAQPLHGVASFLDYTQTHIAITAVVQTELSGSILMFPWICVAVGI